MNGVYFFFVIHHYRPIVGRFLRAITSKTFFSDQKYTREKRRKENEFQHVTGDADDFTWFYQGNVVSFIAQKHWLPCNRTFSCLVTLTHWASLFRLWRFFDEIHCECRLWSIPFQGSKVEKLFAHLSPVRQYFGAVNFSCSLGRYLSLMRAHLDQKMH